MARKNVHPAGPGCLATGAALDAAIGPHQGKAAANSAWCARRWAVELREYRRVSKDDLSQLYARCWNVELNFKHTVPLWSEWVARGLSAVHDGGLLFTLIA